MRGPAGLGVVASRWLGGGKAKAQGKGRGPSLATTALFFPEFALIFFILILSAFITGNSSLEPLIEGLCAQIHVNLR